MTFSKTSPSLSQSCADIEYFAIPYFDYSADLCGDPYRSELNLFMNGNQYMVMPDLISAFKSQVGISEVFYETLPPGVLVNQLEKTRLKMGELIISVTPDLIAASPKQLEKLKDKNLISSFVKYATNDLSMIVKKSNPKQINTLEDLARPNINIAIPNPATEGIGQLVLDALESFGGKSFKDQIAKEKMEKGESFFTQIHHRQSPRWLEKEKIDIAFVWSTEATYLIGQGKNFEKIPIDQKHNQIGHYGIGQLTNSSHFQLGSQFMEFMLSSTAQDIYTKYGFGPAK